MTAIEQIFSVIDAFFERFYIDSISIHDRSQMEKVVANASNHKMSLDDEVIMNGLRKWMAEGRISFGNNDDEFIRLNEEYWTQRIS